MTNNPPQLRPSPNTRGLSEVLLAFEREQEALAATAAVSHPLVGDRLSELVRIARCVPTLLRVGFVSAVTASNPDASYDVTVEAMKTTNYARAVLQDVIAQFEEFAETLQSTAMGRAQ